MLRAGERIGDWIIEGPLGEGGMGAVYRVHSALTERLAAALKVMKPTDMAEVDVDGFFGADRDDDCGGFGRGGSRRGLGRLPERRMLSGAQPAAAQQQCASLVGADIAAGEHDRGALDEIPELANVAGPTVESEPFVGGIGETDRAGLAGAVQEVID